MADEDRIRELIERESDVAEAYERGFRDGAAEVPPGIASQTVTDSAQGSAVHARLAAAGKQLAAAEATRAEAMEKATAAVRAAHEAGLPIAEIARTVGLSRPTIYALLRDHA